MRRTAISVLAVALLLAAGWTVLWFVLADRAGREIDAFLAASAGRGLHLTCADRRIGGYPFRLDVTCGESTASDAVERWAGSAAGLRTAALLYNPGHVIAELDAPARLAGGGGLAPLQFDWALARLSVNLRPSGPRRVSAAIDGLAVEGGEEARLLAAAAELHARPAPDAEATDIAAEASDLRFQSGEAASAPFDLALRARLDAPPQALASGAHDLRQVGLDVTGIDLRLAIGDLLVTAKGALAIAPDGLPSGTLDVWLAGGENAEAALEGLPSAVADTARLYVGAILGFGRPDTLEGRPAKRLTLSIERGATRVGFMTLFISPFF